MATSNQKHRIGPHVKSFPPRQSLNEKPFNKGSKTLLKKPNSANKKCVLVRLSTGKELVTYIPGIDHNLEKHNRLQDLLGVEIKCIYGKFDLLHPATSRNEIVLPDKMPF